MNSTNAPIAKDQKDEITNLENEKQDLENEEQHDSLNYGARWKPKYAFLNDKTDYSERGFM